MEIMTMRLWLRMQAALLIFWSLFVCSNSESVVSLPEFASDGSEFTVTQGESVYFPCDVINSGAYPVVWRKGNRVISAGSVLTAIDQRFNLGQGHGLLIEEVKAADAGVYVCALSTDPVIELKHLLQVMYDPVVETSPGSGEVVAAVGSDAVLECSGHGKPSPRLYWRSQVANGVTEGDDSVTRLVLRKITRQMAGVYECVAENPRGAVAVGRLQLRVQHSPMVEAVARSVHTAAGRHAQLVCQVAADPQAQVVWSRQKSAMLDSSRHQETVQLVPDGERHVLHVRHVVDDDLDTYTCEASNLYGFDRARIILTGVADPVEVVSDTISSAPDKYDLSWQVVSFSQILEYKVAYRRAKHNATSRGPSAWKEVIVPTTGAFANPAGQHRQQIRLQQLQPATVYHVYIQAKNKYGWNAVSEVFRFTTLARGSALESRAGRVGSGADPMDPSWRRVFSVCSVLVFLMFPTIHLQHRQL